MKKIYIILTYSGSILSRAIKLYTKDEFSHVSIALDIELNEMYSFGRLNPYNPFWGGLVHEHQNKGFYKRFYKTIAKIYCLEITDKQYKRIKRNIRRIESNKKHYRFNVIGLFAVCFNIKFKRKHSFYCAEFVKYIMETSNVDCDLPEIIRPENFKAIDGLHEIYGGLFQKYVVNV